MIDWRKGLSVLSLLEGGCVAETPPEAPPAGFDLREEAAARGLTEVVPDPNRLGGQPGSGRGGIALARDLDGDGDIDLVISRTPDPPALFANDGTGSFELAPDPLAEPEDPLGHAIVSALAIDLDGDTRPELLGGGAGFVNLWPNLGALRWGPPTVIPLTLPGTPGPGTLVQSFAAGDFDADGDPDVAAVGIDALGDDSGGQGGGAPDFVLRNDGGVLVPTVELIAGERGSRTMCALSWDEDGDGDLDLHVPGDLGPPSALWHNEGAVSGSLLFVDSAPQRGLDYVMSAMGLDTADLDGDGRVDLCITDRGPPRCLLSAGGPPYLQAEVSLGLLPEAGDHQPSTIGWSFDFVDLNHDGHWDAVQGAGPDPAAVQQGELRWAPQLWAGQGDGTFAPAGAAVGFDDAAPSYGQAIADVDGDHCPDLLLVGPGAPPRLWMNRCGSEAWLDVVLDGPPNLGDPFGATVHVEAGGRRWTRVLSPVRGQGQGPPVVHLGLGPEERFDSVEVRWADGTRSSWGAGEARREVRVAWTGSDALR